MPKISAGLLLFRRTGNTPQVLLVHPGGPYWVKQDAGSWSVPKGMTEEGEGLLAAAQREFTEETGLTAPHGDLLDLGTVTYGNKNVHVWAMESDADISRMQSNQIIMEWPPRSGRSQAFAECDRAEWCDFVTAKTKLVKGQVPFIDRLAAQLGL